MSSSFADARRRAEDEGLLGKGEFFKLKEGDNRFRLLSEGRPHTSTFNGQKNFKWLCYGIDRRDGKVKPYFMPHTIYKAIEALQANPDYAFEDVPMPYDITIYAKGAGTIDVEYSVIPARRETPLTEAELADLAQQKSLKELSAKLKEKEAQKGAPTPTAGTPAAPVSDDDIPF